MILLALNQKGGSGKTTIAAALARGGARVLLIECSALRVRVDWSVLRQGRKLPS
jgi:hypothetical protein